MSGQLKVGMVREITVKTEKEHTAQYFYENLPNVFATPFLAGFMERVSAELINEHIEADEQSVGISMDCGNSTWYGGKGQNRGDGS
jgi:predicted thioesterase